MDLSDNVETIPESLLPQNYAEICRPYIMQLSNDMKEPVTVTTSSTETVLTQVIPQQDINQSQLQSTSTTTMESDASRFPQVQEKSGSDIVTYQTNIEPANISVAVTTSSLYDDDSKKDTKTDLQSKEHVTKATDNELNVSNNELVKHIPTENELNNKTMGELKDYCKALNLRVSGTKPLLVKRIIEVATSLKQ